MVVTQKDRIKIKKTIDELLSNLINEQEVSLRPYLNDSFFPGRRMRPTLLYMLLGAKYFTKEYLPLYIAVELIHRSSIILDDLIDDDDQRRGVTSFHIKHNVNATMLTSHFINSLAYKQVSKFKENTGIDFTNDFNQCYSLMVMGEMADINLLSTDKEFLKFYNTISLKKTNALFVLIMKIFFKIKYKKASYLKSAQHIGEYFGNIYQIQNDIYDELYASLDERGNKKTFYNCLTLPKAIILDIGTDKEKSLIKSVLGKEISKQEQILIRNIFLKKEYSTKLKEILRQQKKYLSEQVVELTKVEQNTFASFMSWLENKNCWNHNEFINAGY